MLTVSVKTSWVEDKLYSYNAATNKWVYVPDHSALWDDVIRAQSEIAQQKKHERALQQEADVRHDALDAARRIMEDAARLKEEDRINKHVAQRMASLAFSDLEKACAHYKINRERNLAIASAFFLGKHRIGDITSTVSISYSRVQQILNDIKDYLEHALRREVVNEARCDLRINGHCISVHFERDPETRRFVGSTFLDIPHCISHGDTLDEAEANMTAALGAILDTQQRASNDSGPGLAVPNKLEL